MTFFGDGRFQGFVDKAALTMCLNATDVYHQDLSRAGRPCGRCLNAAMLAVTAISADLYAALNNLPASPPDPEGRVIYQIPEQLPASHPERLPMVGEVYLLASGPLAVHSQDTCSGRCPIHAPTSHHMVDWPMVWRADRRIIERLCEHSVGHPDPDDMRIWSGDDSGVHGCDGCCREPLAMGHGRVL